MNIILPIQPGFSRTIILFCDDPIVLRAIKILLEGPEMYLIELEMIPGYPHAFHKKHNIFHQSQLLFVMFLLSLIL